MAERIVSGAGGKAASPENPNPSRTRVQENTESGTTVVNTTVHEENVDRLDLIRPGEESFDQEAWDSLAGDLAFMNEPVEIMLLPNQDGMRDSARFQSIGVNGKKYYFLRGEWKTVPRFVAEAIITAKKDAWSFSYKRNPDGSTSDVNQMQRVNRWPYQFRDPTEKGTRWYDAIRDNHR